MAENLVATLNVAFNDDDGLGDNAGQNKIVLQQMTKRFDSKGRLWARCFPSSGVKFTASVGTVEPGEVRSQIMREGLKFSNSSKATLKFPGASNVVITPYVAMKKTKDIYGKTIIVPAFVKLHYDSVQVAVIATEKGIETPIYGACSVQYNALYQVLYYKPKVDAPFGGYNGMVFYTGTIFGYNEYTVETLEMELDMKESPDWVEYARVTSKIVLDAKGVWEFPPNWETTYQGNKKKTGEQREDYSEAGQFPGFSDEIDPDNSFVDVRVHEIIEVNSFGSLMYRNQNGDRIYAPYWGASNNYTPKYEVKFTDPPGGKKAGSAEDFKWDLEHRTWRDVFLKVNKAEVLARLKDEYPGVTPE